MRSMRRGFIAECWRIKRACGENTFPSMHALWGLMSLGTIHVNPKLEIVILPKEQEEGIPGYKCVCVGK